MPFNLINNQRKAQIKVVGVGGAGGNAINRMVNSGMQGADFVAINTDAQALENCAADQILCIGEKGTTHGLGAGGQPEVARAAIEEDRDRVTEFLKDADLVFIAAGMGGGTGTGAAPVVAEIAREHGALTVGIVTEPFQMEGAPRMRNALAGINELQQRVDTLITIKNQRLLAVCQRDTTLQEAFFRADEVLMQAARGITDLITIPGMINLDFNDVKTVIEQGGDAIMGVGTHRSENRSIEAAKKAIRSPLLEDVSIEGAKKVLVNIAAASNLLLHEVNDAMSLIYESVGQEANIIFGTVLDDNLGEDIRITVIATGFHLFKERELTLVEKPAADASPQPQDMSVPAFMRSGRGTGTDGNVSAGPRANQENLDYPAFLRKKMV